MLPVALGGAGGEGVCCNCVVVFDECVFVPEERLRL